jgi:hypothetical protein
MIFYSTTKLKAQLRRKPIKPSSSGLKLSCKIKTQLTIKPSSSGLKLPCKIKTQLTIKPSNSSLKLYCKIKIQLYKQAVKFVGAPTLSLWNLTLTHRWETLRWNVNQKSEREKCKSISALPSVLRNPQIHQRASSTTLWRSALSLISSSVHWWRLWISMNRKVILLGCAEIRYRIRAFSRIFLLSRFLILHWLIKQ